MTAPIMPKHTVLLNLLEGGRNVHVHLDPRRSGTLVPLKFQREPAMVLTLGYALANPIPDLDIAEDGIGATLSFGGRREYTFVPWSAVYAMGSEIGSIVWPEDIPPEHAGARATGLSVPAPTSADVVPAPSAGAAVIDLMSRREPQDRRACMRRLRVLDKLTAPRGPDGAA